MAKVKIPDEPWTRSLEQILDDLSVSAEEGLDPAGVKERRKRFGPNQLRKTKTKSAWSILVDQFKSLMTVLLGIATAVSFAFGDWVEGIAIAAVIIINAGIGFFTEWKAVRSMEALQRLSRVTAKVRREKTVREISASEIVPGDLVLLEGGDIVSADLRLIEASKLQVDESALTGESVPVGKNVESMEGEVELAERANMLFKGTAVTRGSGIGVVTNTGMGTELGKISALVEEAEEEQTPLEKRLDQLGRKLIYVTLGVASLVIASGIMTGKDLFLMIETGIALAVATIPEGLPIVATIALARGMLRMARRNALINRLSAVETLGATGVICTDKTGTLTENRMAVVKLVFDSGEIDVGGGALGEEGQFTRGEETIHPYENDLLQEGLRIGVLCNNASFQLEERSEKKTIGDPMEVALLVAGRKAGIDQQELVKKYPEAREEAFDPEVKMMATFHREDSEWLVAVKGAPESVLEVSSHLRTKEGQRELRDEDRGQWIEQNRKMAEEGLRILALGTKTAGRVESNPYEGLTFVGLVGLVDPPRKDVRQAIASCREAGITVVMVTGDQPATARHVALSVGLVEEDQREVILGKNLRGLSELSEQASERLLKTRVFARVNPKEKLNLIEIHQKKGGAIVGMTGDGVNDAPALKKADIGIAMGQRGTQVAREAADMVLKDDAFSTIVSAVEQGRIIFGNIRKFVVYLISCNVSEVMVVGLASLFNAPLPILPLQILFLNLVTDVFPALALGVGEGDPAIMKHPPRDPQESILTRRHWLAIGAYGGLITFAVLGALSLALFWLKMEEGRAVTVSFLTLAFAQMWHVFNMRETGSRLFVNEMTHNPFVWGALVLCTGLLVGAIYLPGLSGVLKVMDPGINGWTVILTMSLVPLVTGQLFKTIRSLKRYF